MKGYGVIMISLFCAVSSVQGQTNAFGSVSFSVGRSPVSNPSVQPVTLYGCNNTLVKSNVFWDTENQVLGHVPYGQYQSKSGKSYFLGKYYISSPPAAEHDQHKPPFIGLVTPDQFRFHGKRPTKIVYLNYRILNPVYLANIPVDFNYKYHGKSCADQGVNLIPINTVCKNFSWQNGAIGASGIGQLSIHPASTAFLPTLGKNKNPLQCQVTLLDDIMLDHQVFFATPQGKSKTINLTQYYKDKKTMALICIPRKKTDVPAGCVAKQ